MNAAKRLPWFRLWVDDWRKSRTIRQMTHEERGYYLDLLIETMNLVVLQMDALVAEGLDAETAATRMDFSAVQERFTAGDPFLDRLFDIWFKTPISQAAWLVANSQDPEVEY